MESQPLRVHEKATQDEEEEEDGAEVPCGTTTPRLLCSRKPELASQGGQDQDLLITSRDLGLDAPGGPALTAKDFPPLTSKGPPAQATSLPGNLSATCSCRGVAVTLCNNHMWNDLHRCGTEMILSKYGRHMCPYYSFGISGLDPLQRYTLAMDILPVDSNRWRWNGRKWEVSGKAEPHIPGRVFIHPDSPSTGDRWSNGSVSFYELILTNSCRGNPGHLILHSMHRYLPRLHVVPSETADVLLDGPDVMTFIFPQTEFFAVTSYQNPQVKRVKSGSSPSAVRRKRRFSLPPMPSKSFACSSLDINSCSGSDAQLSDRRRSLRCSLMSKEDSPKSLKQKQSLGRGAVSLNGVQNIEHSDSAIRGKRRSDPSMCSEQKGKRKVRRGDPGRVNGVCADEDSEQLTDAASQEPSLPELRKPCTKAVRGRRRFSLPSAASDINSCSSSNTTLSERRRSLRSLSMSREDSVKFFERKKRRRRGAVSLNGVQSRERMDRAVRGERRSDPSVRSEQKGKRKLRIGDPWRINGVCADEESELHMDAASQEPSSLDPRVSSGLFSQSPAGSVQTLVTGNDKSASSLVTPDRHLHPESGSTAHSSSHTRKLIFASTWKRKLGKRKLGHRKRRYSTHRPYIKKSVLMARERAARPLDTAGLPDLEDVEGMLFVSFVSKEALVAHLGDAPLSKEGCEAVREQIDLPDAAVYHGPQLPEASPVEAEEGVEEEISRLQDDLLDLQSCRHRQLIHPLLREVGLKLSSLDLTLAIDLRYLGVTLPLPLSLVNPEDNQGSAGLVSSPEGTPFLSRTGKTTDMTKIKGWREKFVACDTPLTSKNTDGGAVLGTDSARRNSSVFCSDMLDEYLEREAPLMDMSAAAGPEPSPAPNPAPCPTLTPLPVALHQRPSPAPSPTPLLLQQRPVQGNSYILPLQAVLAKQPLKPTVALTPAPSPSLQRPSASPKPRQVFRPACPKSPALSRAKHPLPASCRSKAVTQGTPASRSAPGLQSFEAAAATRAMAKVMLRIMEMEDWAESRGHARITVTMERAEQALAALLTAEAVVKKRKRFWPQPQRPMCSSLACRRASCRLGCVCGSLARGHRVVTHCRKPACMFGCSCLKHKMVLLRPSPTSPAPREDGGLCGQKTPNSDPEHSAVVKEEMTECPLTCGTVQGDTIGRNTPGEEFLPVKQEMSPAECHSACESESIVLVGRENPEEARSPIKAESEQDIVASQAVNRCVHLSVCDSEESAVDTLRKSETESTSYPRKRRKRRRRKKKKKRRRRRRRERLSYAILEAEQEAEPAAEPAADWSRLWNRKGEEADPEPLYRPEPVILDPFSPPPPVNHSRPNPAPQKTYVPRPNPVIRDEDKDPVYLYFERMMTCARVREYKSKRAEDRSPSSSESAVRSAKEQNLHHFSFYPGEGRSADASNAQRRGTSSAGPRRTLEVLSECDWQSEQTQILNAVCHRAARGSLSRPFSVGPFLIRPFGPALRKEPNAGGVTHKVLITRPSPGEENCPTPLPEAGEQDRPGTGPPWSGVLPAGLLSARKRLPGLPAKGLIEVNGKSYSQAKIQLGQMGALHMTSRLAAYLTGRWLPENQKKSEAALPISGPIRRSCAEKSSPLPLPLSKSAVSPTATPSSAAKTATKLPELPLSPMLLVPAEDPNAPPGSIPAPVSLAPLAPGESVVLHPVSSPTGTPLFRHPSGRLVHLLPLNQLRPVSPGVPVRSPGPWTIPPLQTPAKGPAGTETGAANHADVPPAVPTSIHTTVPTTLSTAVPISIPTSPPASIPTTMPTSVPMSVLSAQTAVTAAAKQTPSFLAQQGTQTIRISTGIAGRTRSKCPPPAGFTRLQIPETPAPQTVPGDALCSPASETQNSPAPEPQLSAETEGAGSGHSDTPSSPGEQDSPAVALRPVETSQSRGSLPVRRLAVTLYRAAALTAGEGQTGGAVVEKKVLLADFLNRSDEDSLSESDDSLQSRPSETPAQRQGLNALERHRRSQMNDLFARLQGALGIESESKVPKVYILSRAREEIDLLEEECDHLKKKKRRLTQMRTAFIDQLAQSSEISAHALKRASPKHTDRSTFAGEASEDSEEDGASKSSDSGSDFVDVETVGTRDGKSSWTTESAQRSEAGVTHPDDSQSEVDSSSNASRHVESERRRRMHMNGLFSRLLNAVGIQSAAKITQPYILSRALAVIQDLKDESANLEQTKERMTRKRTVYIREIARRSGKSEELIKLKLEDICAKQRILEAKKRKAQHQAPGPHRKHSPLSSAAESQNIVLPKIVSVQSLATPLPTIADRKEQDDWPVSPVCFQNGGDRDQ